MIEKRIHSLTAVGLLVAGLCAIASWTSATGAAVDTSETSPRELRGRIVIACDGLMRGVYPPAAPRGDCTLSGAIVDDGKFVDSDHHRVKPRVRVLSLAKGTIEIGVYRERRGHWKILNGSRAYAGLRGRGWEATTPQVCRAIFCPISIEMTGRVFQPVRR